ncbi:MAG: DUF3817 domain-containing protein [Actinobacteria bacterium]|nr:DUF3817 domain-containing protein [Actinomycetota bacterium]MSW26959.1 DUF3817 domain-containing protein [Actinomycetota bacterium]MSW34769.1 DUF3817 domain-containing protein [Actinomycetota bacterium]MSX31813.1 DUF3817 domain-containing protein [Actinomycetota bacterium]MSX51968.1 DUF3817 domain-containing protein [Actinomycetota bacterium]
MGGTLLRFRIMALFSGTMMILLCFVEIPVKHLMHNPGLASNLVWIPVVHGFTYPLYVIAAIQFSFKARFSVVKMFAFILAGTLPLASLFAERHAVSRYR